MYELIAAYQTLVDRQGDLIEHLVMEVTLLKGDSGWLQDELAEIESLKAGLAKGRV